MSRFKRTAAETVVDNVEDAVLSADSSAEFSGFSDFEGEAQGKKPCVQDLNSANSEEISGTRTDAVRSFTIPRLSSVVTVANSKKQKEKSKSKKKEKPKKKQTSPSAPVFDIQKLSQNDLSSLRQALGISNQTFPGHVVPDYESEEADYYQSPLGALENLPNIHVEVSEEDVSSGLANRGKAHVRQNVSRKMVDALFNDSEGSGPEDKEWDLPRLKAPEKGKAVNDSLANLINTACVEQCDIDKDVGKYKIPENCSKISPPSVNKEIWKILDKRTQGQDRGFQDIQTLVASSIVPIIRLSEILKPQINSNLVAKTLLSDALTFLGQVQLQLSLRRRYMIRPNLKKKYFNLCNVNTPISEKLFGDDLAKEIKNCEAMSYIGKESQRYPTRGRGYGNYGRMPRRGFPIQSNRYQPYYNQSSSYGYQRGYQVGRQASYRGRGRRGATSTVTSPNE